MRISERTGQNTERLGSRHCTASSPSLRTPCCPDKQGIFEQTGGGVNERSSVNPLYSAWGFLHQPYARFLTSGGCQTTRGCRHTLRLHFASTNPNLCRAIIPNSPQTCQNTANSLTPHRHLFLGSAALGGAPGWALLQ